MNDLIQRLAIVALAVIAYLTGVIPAEVGVSEVALTAAQWLGLMGVIVAGYVSPSKVKAAGKAVGLGK